MQKEITNVLRYFAYFNYPPTFEEVWTFLSTQITKHKLKEVLAELQKRKKIMVTDVSNFKFQVPRYTLGEYNNFLKEFEFKVQSSKCKVDSVKLFVRILSRFPQIKLIGISGSVAMMNAKENDDIDLFIITQKKRIWTARFIAVLLAEFTGRRRRRNEKHTQNKICLNMFVDESNLSIPHKKQTIYVAHEVLQMKPIMSKFSTYTRFLEANQWVYTFFPNARLLEHKLLNLERKSNVLSSMFQAPNSIGDSIEFVLKKIQLTFIRRHTTSEVITDTQLWFFPADFERKLQKDKMI